MHGDEIVFSSDSSAFYRIEPEPPYVNGNIDIFLESLKNLAKTYLRSRNYTDAAEGTLQQILILTQQYYGRVHLGFVNCLIDLATFYYSQNKFGKAEPLFLEAIALKQQLLGDEHLDVANIMLDLAAIYNAEALYEKAEAIFLKALAIKQKILGEGHLEIATNLVNLATIYYAQKRYQEVKSLYEQALKIYQRSLNSGHPNVISVQRKLASIKTKLRPQWLSWQFLIPIILIFLAGGITYIFFTHKNEITCVKLLPNGKTQAVSSEECRPTSQ
jgi:tetratricopeptide (TPR) repeat protein